MFTSNFYDGLYSVSCWVSYTSTMAVFYLFAVVAFNVVYSVVKSVQEEEVCQLNCCGR
jgi:hypothetical protein